MDEEKDEFVLRSRVIFIDSSVYHSNNYQFTAKDLESLTRLLEAGQATLLFTSVTVAEIKRHLKVQAKEALSAAQSFQQKGRILRNLSEFSDSVLFGRFLLEDVEAELVGRFDKFLSTKNVEIISVDLASAEKVFEDYFSVRPPFSEKKPHEFRDAFVLETLKVYAVENEVRVHVISSDSDMRYYCEQDNYLFWSGSLGEVVNALKHSRREEPLVFADKAYQSVRSIFLQIVQDYVSMQQFDILVGPGESIYDFEFSVEKFRAFNERVFSAGAKNSRYGVDFEFDVVVGYSKSGECLGYLSDRDVNPTYQKEVYSLRYVKRLEAELELSYFEGDLESVTLDDYEFDLIDGDILEYPAIENVSRPRMFPSYEIKGLSGVR